MITTVIDTHAVIWYYSGAPELSADARRAIDETIMNGNEIAIASITLVEIIYLVEKGRLASATLDLVLAALDDLSLGLKLVPLDRAVSLALRQIPRALVPDMPDRIITATARRLNLPLVSADRDIQASGVPIIW